MSRTVTAHLFQAVNGVVEGPDQFQFDCFGEEEGALMGAAIGDATDVVIGRVLWEEWSQYWPAHAGDPFAGFINPVRKHVVSTTRSGELGWNSTVIDGDPASYVARLRESGEGSVLVVGGVETVRRLFLAGAIDRLTLTTHPATGTGRRLFDDTVPVTRLALVDHTVTSVGNAVLTYSLR